LSVTWCFSSPRRSVISASSAVLVNLPFGADETDALLLRLRKQPLGDLVLTNELSRHGIVHLGRR
jgi:hypothetical protein